MGSHVIQASLTGGELAPALQGRVDMALYAVSLKTCRNFIVFPYGGVKNRPGTYFCGEVKDSTKRTRLIPFQFNETQTYALEFGDGYMRVYQNAGRVVLSASPSVYSGSYTYAQGDVAYRSGVDYYSIADNNAGNTPESSPAWWYPLTPEPGSNSIVEIPTPYTESDLSSPKWAQSADVVTIVHGSYQPKQLARTANDAWTLKDFEFKNGPFTDINTNIGITVEADKPSGRVTITATGDIFAATDVGRLLYMEQKDFGVPWEVGKSITQGEIRRSDGKYYQAANTGTTGTLRPTHQEDSWNDGGVTWVYLHSGWGIGKIVAYTSPTEVDIDALSRIPDSIVQGSVVGGTKTITAAATTITGGLTIVSNAHGYTVGSTISANITMEYVSVGPYGDADTSTITWVSLCFIVDGNTITAYTQPPWFSSFLTGSMVGISTNGVSAAPTYKWALCAWGGSQGWPTCVTYHQQRQFFAATAGQPRTIWGSRTADFLDFGKSNPLQDDDRITSLLASSRIDSIRYLHPMKNLMVLTAGGEWSASSGSESVLKPSNISFSPESYHGASDLPVLGVGNTALFLQNKGQVVRDMTYEFSSNAYAGNDLTVKASHLLEGHTITRWAYQQTPIQCIWAVRDDGVLLGLTYMREQQVAAWHRHDTDGLVEDLIVISEGTEDRIYMIVNRTINGTTKRYVERMESRLITDVRDAFFVDCGLSFDGRNTLPITLTLTGGTNWDETESLTVTSSVGGGIFAWPALTDIGDQLIYEDDEAGITYRLTVTGVSSANVATVTPDRAIPAEYRSDRSDWAWARGTFTGLDHLEGKTVSILADGNVQTQRVVTAGQITIDPPGARVHVGLPIEADLETLDLNIANAATLLPMTKAIPSVTFLVHETSTIFAGRSFDKLVQAKSRTTENYDRPVNLTTGKVQISIPTGWNKGGQVCMRVNDPLPVSVLAVIPEVEVGKS